MTAPLAWHAYTSVGHMRAEACGETWKLGPKRENEPVRLAFFLNDGRNLVQVLEDRRNASVEKGSTEYWRYVSLRETDLECHGYADTADDAQALIEILRSGDTSGDAEALLLEAGFLFAHEFSNQTRGGNTRTTKIYRKVVGRAFFSLAVSTDGLHLTFEKDGWQHWENLASFSSKGECYDGAPLPIFWPDRVAQNFDILALRACLTMVDRYIADGRHRRRKRRRG